MNSGKNYHAGADPCSILYSNSGHDMFTRSHLCGPVFVTAGDEHAADRCRERACRVQSDSASSSPGASSGGSAAAKKLTIGSIVPTLDAQFFQRYVAFMKTCADALGVELITVNADNSGDKLSRSKMPISTTSSATLSPLPSKLGRCRAGSGHPQNHFVLRPQIGGPISAQYGLEAFRECTPEFVASQFIDAFREFREAKS